MWMDALVAAMAFVTVGLSMWAILGGRQDMAGQLEQRLGRMGLREVVAEAGEDDAAARSREALQRALQELETIKRSQGRSFLQGLLKSSGTGRSLRTHVLMSTGIGLTAAAAVLLVGLVPVAAAGIGALVGTLLPILHLRNLANRRMSLFVEDLPGALDLIVRGIRAGLPLMECLKLTAAEWRDPLRSEFLQVINDMSVGLSIKDAVARFAERVPLQEARLFAIVIAIQSQSGGNLSEVLSSLADLLRERAKLHAKIRAMTSESRASAWIIGSIPFLLVGAVSVLSPGFLTPLFETQSGNLILMGCGAWMAVGMIVMKSMMRVDL
jgi:tight adherence protein B